MSLKASLSPGHAADVSITHLTFSKEFTKAIEQKQVAEQDAERQMYVVQRADQERKVGAQAVQVTSWSGRKDRECVWTSCFMPGPCFRGLSLIRTGGDHPCGGRS